jgi:hypothetical protein
MNNAVFWDIKTPVCTSQETHYVSATESSRLMLCKICGFHGGDYEEWCLLGMLRRVALVRTDVTEELSASIIRVTGIGELAATLTVTSNFVPTSPILVTMMMEALSSSETSVLTRTTPRNVPEDAILQFEFSFMHLCSVFEFLFRHYAISSYHDNDI